jgi:hypothetical protein
MTEQETRRIAREEIARALEAMRARAGGSPALRVPLVLTEDDVCAALAALREPEPKTKPVMLWRAWQANDLSGCFESAFPVRIHPRGHLEFEVSRGAWKAGMPIGVRCVSSRNGEKPGMIEWIGPGPDPREASESAGAMLARLGTDGREWAVEFRKTALRLGYSDMDEGWLIGWFCNAIMASADAEARKRDAASAEPRAASELPPLEVVALLKKLPNGAHEAIGIAFNGSDYALAHGHRPVVYASDALAWRDEALKQKARADEAEKRGREKMREEVVAVATKEAYLRLGSKRMPSIVMPETDADVVRADTEGRALLLFADIVRRLP